MKRLTSGIDGVSLMVSWSCVCGALFQARSVKLAIGHKYSHVNNLKLPCKIFKNVLYVAGEKHVRVMRKMEDRFLLLGLYYLIKKVSFYCTFFDTRRVLTTFVRKRTPLLQIPFICKLSTALSFRTCWRTCWFAKHPNETCNISNSCRNGLAPSLPSPPVLSGSVYVRVVLACPSWHFE